MFPTGLRSNKFCSMTHHFDSGVLEQGKISNLQDYSPRGPALQRLCFTTLSQYEQKGLICQIQWSYLWNWLFLWLVKCTTIETMVMPFLLSLFALLLAIFIRKHFHLYFHLLYYHHFMLCSFILFSVLRRTLGSFMDVIKCFMSSMQEIHST